MAVSPFKETLLCMLDELMILAGSFKNAGQTPDVCIVGVHNNDVIDESGTLDRPLYNQQASLSLVAA